MQKAKKMEVYEFKFEVEYISGKELNKAITIQENTVSTKASLILIFSFFFLKEKYNTSPIIKVIKLEKKNKSQKGWHINIYYTSYMIWKTHPTIGGGLKSFRHDCFKISPNVSYANKISCGNHSHNYYLEILTELGVIGLLIFISCLFIL